MSLESVFNPRRVALVGASDQPGKVGSLLWNNLSSFDGEVVPVTPTSGSVGGVATHRSLAEVEGELDLAVVAVPAQSVPAVARQAAEKGVGAMVVLSGGFAETGEEGAALQAELAHAAGETRIVGPNCFGVQNAARNLNASIAPGSQIDPGGIALITQSGAYGMAIHAMGTDEQIRFGKVLASGNKVDIADHEVISYLGSDPDTEVICLFAESVEEGAALASAIRATTPTKPVVIVKTGRSSAGERAARSHTGALATNDAVFRAVVRQSGAITVRSGLEMLDVARVLAHQPLPAGTRAAIITNSGGTGVELTDMLADEGVEVPELSSGLQATLAEILPAFASARNPVDMTPVWSRFAELYPWLIETLASSGEVDLVIPILLQRSAMDEETVGAVARVVEELRREGSSVPVYCCWVAPRAARSNADRLQAAGVPCLEWPDRTARAIGHAVRYARFRSRITPAPHSPRVARTPLSAGPMPPLSSAEVLDRFGVGTVETAACESSEDAVGARRRLGETVVMKAADPALAHRTEAGGVLLGLSTDEEVTDAYRRLARMGGTVLVQPQIDGVEVAVGGVADPVFGPVVMVGMGGVAVEVLGDVDFALAPLHHEEALALIRSLRGHELLAGFRGSKAVDLDALAQVVVGVGDFMAAHPEVDEVDLNPVMATPDGAVAVDWKVTVGTRSRTKDKEPQ